ncbi:MAG TPA: hypothetical protein VM492_05245, partial [Sumerlaeia bacterium]|nr:hypothetical protein [Sumerlaeia bacterium]
VAGWGARAEDAPPGRLRRSELLFLRSAVWIGIGASLRYEMWYVGILLGIFLAARLVLFSLSSRHRREAWVLALACLILAAFPAAWAVSCYRWHGSPVAFVRFATEGNAAGNLFYDLSSPMRRFLVYPMILWQDHWHRLGLAFVGIAFAFSTRKKPAMFFVAIVALILFCSMLVCAKSGVGSNNRARYSEFLVLPLLCLGAGPLACLWSGLRGRKMRAARTLIVCFILFYAFVSLRQACAGYPNAWGVPVEFLSLIQRLEREHDSSRYPASLIQIPHKDLEVYSGGSLHETWMAMYHSNYPLKVRELVHPAQLEERLRRARKKTHFLVKTPRPDIVFPERAKLLETIGTYELWEVTGSREKDPTVQ